MKVPPRRQEGRGSYCSTRTVSLSLILGVLGVLAVYYFHFGATIAWQGQAVAPTSSQRTRTQQHTSQQLCADTCKHRQESVLCDLGTDCTDCGVWHQTDTDRALVNKGAQAWSQKGPIAYLTDTWNLTVLTRMTETTPPFQVVYTDPKIDLDTSESLSRTGWLEGGITGIFRQVLSDACVDPSTGRRRLVLDVGANFGYFTVYAAMMGCRVMAWEPVPHYRAFITQNILLNNVSHLVTLRDRVVSEKDGKEMEMQVPTRGNLGTASVEGINQHFSHVPKSITVTSERVDSVVHEHVILMKVDVEGFEPYALQSSERLFMNNSVDNIILEYNPGVAEAAVMTRPEWAPLVTATPEALLALSHYGFRMGMMLDHIGKGNLIDRMVPLPEIVPTRLKYDIADAKAFVGLRAQVRDRSYTGPISYFNCEALKPLSLRSSFMINTNIWAARTTQHIQFDGIAGAMSPKQSAKKDWFIRPAKPHEPFAMGSASCAHLPAAQLVRKRCSCNYSEMQKHPPDQIQRCRREEALVQKLMDSGVLKYEDDEL